MRPYANRTKRGSTTYGHFPLGIVHSGDEVKANRVDNKLFGDILNRNRVKGVKRDHIKLETEAGSEEIYRGRMENVVKTKFLLSFRKEKMDRRTFLKKIFYRHSLSVTPETSICQTLCLSVCLAVLLVKPIAR